MAAKKELIPIGNIRSEITHLDYFSGINNGIKWQKTGNIQAFYIPVKETTSFKFIVHKAKNPEATAKRVFLAMQPLENFKKPTGWIPLNGNVAEEPIHSYINRISQNQIDDKSFDPLDDTMTKGVGVNYFKTFEVHNGVFTYLTFELRLEAKDIGQAFWLEAFNFLPEWGESKSINKNSSEFQGFIIAVVDSVQILNFFAKKRTEDERKIEHVTQETITDISKELAYGDILDIHISIHTQKRNFPTKLTIVENYSKKEVYEYTFNEENYKTTTTAFQNLYTIVEVHLKPNWINDIKHIEGSVRYFTMRLEMMPLEFIALESADDRAKEKVKEIAFKINYKKEWSLNEDGGQGTEEEWLPEIVEIKEATLVSQEHEECGFEDIKITDSCSPFYIIEKSDKGEGLKTNITTPILEFVGGNSEKPQTITIDLGNVKTTECQKKAGFDNTKDNGDSHVNNTFNTEHLATGTVKSKLFGSLTPVKFNSPSESKIELELVYPYEADNYLEVFAKYMFGAKPLKFPLIIQSCRYIRTPIIMIYPDLQWAVHINYAADKVLYYKGEEEGIVLIEFNRDLYAYLKPVIKFLYTKVIKPIEEFLQAYKHLASDNTDDFSLLGKDLDGLVNKFVKSETETIKLGYHHKINGKVINYAEVKPINYFLYYYAFVLSLSTLALDLVILYFVTGRMKLKSLKKSKNLKEAFNKISNSKIKFIYPKVSCNYGYEYEQMAGGKTALIIRFTLQAKPFLGVSIEHKIKPKNESLKDKLSANFNLSLEAEADINVKYNVFKGTWALNENAPEQTKALHTVKQNKTASQKIKELFGNVPPEEVKNGEPFIEGDIIRIDFKMKCNAKITGELKKKYYLISFAASAKLEGEIKSFIGVEKMIGFDNQRGPFIQDRIYFSGLQYKIKAEYKVSLYDWEPAWLNDSFDDEGNFIEPFDFKAKRMYLMEEIK